MRFWSSIDYGPMFAIPNSSDNAFDGVEVNCVHGSHLLVKCYISAARRFVNFDGFNDSQKFIHASRLFDNKNPKELTIKGVLLQFFSHIPAMRVLVKILIILGYFVRRRMIQ